MQPPTQQHSLRHHPSGSNDALRGFGPINPPGVDPNTKQPFPQELYSSSAITDPSPFSRSGSEYDYPLNGSINGLGSSSQPVLSNRPSPNTFGMGPQPVSAFPLSGGPILPSSLMQPVQKQPPQQPVMPIMPQHPTNGTQLQNASMYSSVPPSQAPGVQLAQIFHNLPPQQKAVVMGRLQEMALNPQQSQPQPSQQQQQAQPPQNLSVQPPQPGTAPEEISTIFVVGFPDDMTEREFQNMFTFCPGYEAATLKVPPKDLPPQGPQNPVVVAAANALAGASDPYNLVTVNSGGVVVDQGNNTTATTSSTWASGLEDPYTRHALAAAAATTSNTSELAQQLALAQQSQPRKQIIGFAKFRSKEEALHARDVLHGRRVDIEKGALLKAEMAKKNLHTKRGVGPLQVSLPTGVGGVPTGNSAGPAQGGATIFTESPTPVPGSIGPGKQQLSNQNGSNGLTTQDNVASLSSSFASLSTGASPSELSTIAPSAPLGSESPTFKLQRINDIAPFVPNSGPTLMTSNLGDQPGFYATPPSSFHRNGMQSLQHQPSLSSLAEGRPSEGFHALPNKPVSDVVKANALPPTNLPPPSIASSTAGSRKAASSRGDSPPTHQESDAGYISDALSTSHQSERSRTESFSRYGGYTPPPEESHVHLPQHLLQDDVLGTPQQTDYASKLIETPDYAGTADWSTVRPTRKMTEPSGTGFSSGNDLTPGFIGSSASSVAGSVSSGGAESINSSTTSGGNGPAGFAPPPELGRQRGRTMPSLGGVMNGGSTSGSEQPGRHSGDHPRRGGNAADQNPPINTLYVGNLPTSLPTPQSAKVLEDALVQIFSRCAGYSKMVFRQKNNGPMCFVEFDDVSSASKALNELYGSTLNGLVKGGGIRLSYSKNPLGVRTAVPNNATPGKVTSPVHSPTTHAPYPFGNLPPGMQEPRGMPMDMPRGSRMRGDTMDMMMGPGSPPGRFMAASPPNGQLSGFSPMGKPVATFARGPMNLGMQGTQPFIMASSPPAQSPISSSGYQPSTAFQPFGQLDMTRELGQSGVDPNTGA